MARTLYQKLWDDHVVAERADGTTLLYIDRHLAHEVSTPQSFEILRTRGRTVRRPQTHVAVPDHAVSTRSRSLGGGEARALIARLYDNAEAFGLPLIRLGDPRQGIVHVIGPELGFTQPGLTIACGDSHTSTHGAFGALAFGIGASECGTVMATQCLIQRRAKTMAVEINGALSPWVSAKDVALAVIAALGPGGAAGHAVEYRGPVVAAMSMEARMTLCNMTIEAGARIGLVAPDQTTFDYLAGRPMVPQGEALAAALAHWHTLASDPDAKFDRTVTLDGDALAPFVSWGTTPSEAAPITGHVPETADDSARLERVCAYMGLKPGQPLATIAIDQVFIGSCTNGRIEDLRAAAAVARGRRVAEGVRAMVVPGSAAVRRQAEAEGLDRIFVDAGYEWREAGCSMCVAINDDRLAPGQRCAATSNRNFEGRQGQGARTHLMSPAMAAAAAATGRLTDVRTMETLS
ncbi:MAG: 3-isopropylmalate dehydratase large subunit [Polymorphobacter sp.]|uniref:3-isopropylmalate dehydratase large subunit n=1 Tax=Polymorphobacter sp. TaxID=1909290 RepID=UPI003A879B82